MRWLIWFLIALPLAATAQGPEPTLRSTTSEVLLDFVVRDKHGKIVRDLNPGEVQVFEDGVPQKLRHFDFFDEQAENKSNSPHAPRASTGAATLPSSNNPTSPLTVNELRDINVVSVVIAHLDSRGREITLHAMRQFARKDLSPNTYVGVFSLGDGQLREVQSYTNDAAKISAAVGKLVDDTLNGEYISSGQFDSTVRSPGDVDEFSKEALQFLLAEPANTFVAAAGKGGGANSAIEELTLPLWAKEMGDVYADSMSFLVPLRELAQSQSEISGRKVMLLFSSGLPVEADSVELLHSVISTANRSNVSIYALDTRGITPADNLDDARRRLLGAVNASMNMQLGTVLGGSQAVTADQAISQELAESSIHSDTRQNLAELAEGTGGALLPDTLDLREPIREAIESSRLHYEVTYSPSNTAVDGEFRKIEVKVTRPGTTVFARSGYYAVPVVNGRQVYPFEMATLKALNTQPDLRQFAFNTAALEFRIGAVRNQFAYVFQVPTRNLSVTTDRQWAKVHVSVTAVVKDTKGQIVDKISRDIPYALPVAMKARMEKGIVGFSAPMFLAPGHYTIETAAVDRQGMKASVRRTSLDVDPGSGFSMSDVAAVRRVDDLHGTADPLDPFESRGGKVTPEIGDGVHPDAAGNLKFYAVAYPPSPVDATPAIEVEVRQDDQVLARSPVHRVPLDANGAASALVTVPTANLQPGRYDAVVTFEYKGEKLTKTITFALATESSSSRASGIRD